VLKDSALGPGNAFPETLTGGDITYIDQTVAEDGKATFNEFLPRSLPDSSVFITGSALDEPLFVGQIEGHGVSGKVQIRSYDPKNPVTITLREAGTDTELISEIFEAAPSGNGQSTLSFTLENIPDGQYDLSVAKAGHVGYVIKNLTVAGEDVDLTAHSNPKINTIVLAAGQLNSDRFVNSSDLSILISGANYGKTAANAANALTDINGDGYVNSSDLSILISGANYGKTVETVEYTQ
jgi:hypothetical protein